METFAGPFFSSHLQGNTQYCSIDDMFCIPANYSKFNPPLNPPGEPPAEVQIGLDNFEILKIDDREFTIEINAYFIVKWRDKRIEVCVQQTPKVLLTLKISRLIRFRQKSSFFFFLF